MKGIASACGSATIINAIATGRGAAFAVDLRVEAEVNLTESKTGIEGSVGDTDEDPTLIETCVDRTLEELGVRESYGAEVETNTDFPIAVGLSSSSAAANATVMATHDALDREPEPLEAIEIGIGAAFEAGTTITGAFDDATASYLGGGTFTDNETREILKRWEISPELRVLIYVPPERSYTQDTDAERMQLIGGLVKTAEEEALEDNIYGAQTLNGLLYSSVLEYDPGPALEALEAGAKSAGLTGTGPATVAISREDGVGGIREAWGSREGKILQTSPSKEGARIEDE